MRPSRLREKGRTACADLLFSHPDYDRRYGNFTRSGACALRRLYCRWRFPLRPKEYSFCMIIPLRLAPVKRRACIFRASPYDFPSAPAQKLSTSARLHSPHTPFCPHARAKILNFRASALSAHAILPARPCSPHTPYLPRARAKTLNFRASALSRACHIARARAKTLNFRASALSRACHKARVCTLPRMPYRPRARALPRMPYRPHARAPALSRTRHFARARVTTSPCGICDIPPCAAAPEKSARNIRRRARKIHRRQQPNPFKRRRAARHDRTACRRRADIRSRPPPCNARSCKNRRPSPY